MKNNKGFTLVEILAVIVVLAIIMIIAIPSIGGALNGAKNKIGELEKKNIQDAAETIVVEIINCDISFNDYNYLFNKSITSCANMKNGTINNEINTTMAKLKEKNYFNDTANKCNGNLKITTDNNFNVSVDTSEIVCN